MEFPPPQRLTLPDGRNISYAIFGDTTTTTTTTSSSSSLSKTIFYHHGFPSSRNEAFYLSSAASAHGIRLISIDRPGHGFSSAQPGRMILDSAADVEMLAAHLGIKSYAVLGVSGGAPYALACAWRNMSSSGSSNDGRDRVGSRCIGIATVSGLYPASLGLKGILPITRLAFFVAAYLSQGLVSRAMRWAVGSADFETSRKRFGNTIKSSRPREDWDAWMKYPDFQSALAAGVVGAFEGEGLGGGREAYLFAHDWGFNLEDIHIKPGQLVMWHGAMDVNVPLRMAETAASLIKNAELRVSERDAHLSLMVEKRDEIMKTMSEMFSPR